MIVLVVKHVICNISGKCGSNCCYIEFAVIYMHHLLNKYCFYHLAIIYIPTTQEWKDNIVLEKVSVMDNNSLMNIGVC